MPVGLFGLGFALGLVGLSFLGKKNVLYSYSVFTYNLVFFMCSGMWEWVELERFGLGSQLGTAYLLSYLNSS